MTHFATADEVGDAFLASSSRRSPPFAAEVKQTHPDAVIHAANSAATLRDPATHFDLVRCGVAIYGLDPFQRDPAEQELEPALDLRSYVAAVKPIAPGQSAGYGRRFVADHPTTLATIPIGYGDGVRRALTNNADVVVRGRRHPLVGTVSMDNITVDLGLETDVRALRRGRAARRRGRLRRGVGPPPGHHQLRDHVRPDRAGRAPLPPRWRLTATRSPSPARR